MGEITEADREAFKELAGLFGPHAERADAGEHDADWRMAILAGHRQAAEKAQQERDAKVAQERAEAYHAIPRVNVLNAARAGEAERIATAIRSQGHE